MFRETERRIAMRFFKSSGGEHGPPGRFAWSRAVILVGLILSSTAGTVQADTIIPDYKGVGIGPGSKFTWNYDLSLSFDAGPSQVMTGDFFAMIDVGGLDTAATLALVNSGTPTDWSVSFEATTVNYNIGVFGTDTAAPNVRWTYNGATSITTAGLLGRFKFVSDLHRIRFDQLYSGNDHNNPDPPPLPSKRNNNGFIEGPSETGPDAVPLPITASSGLLLLGLFGKNRIRRR